MIEWSLDAFSGCAALVVAVPPELADASSPRYPDIRQVGPGDGVTTLVAGGATRAQSVANALAEVKTELVAIHDAARPLVTPALIEALVADLDENPEAAAVIAASAVTDTVKRSRPKKPTSTVDSMGLEVEATLDRSVLWGAQTPQVFRAAALREALEVDEATRDAATDEAMLVEAAGGRVLLHPVAAPNLKVTTPDDLRIAELLLSQRA